MRNGLFIADAHAHLFPEPVRVYGREVHFTVSHLIEAMDAYGVDLAVVIARPHQQLPLDELRSLHERLAELVSLHPRRLTAFCWAAPRLGRKAVAEVRRCFEELGYKGLKLHPSLEQFNIDDDDLRAFVEVARAYRAPVTVHTQLAVRGSEPWRLVPLAEAFPEVTFLMAHLGGDGGMVQSLAAAKVAAESPNIAVEVSTTVTDPWATFAGPAELLGAHRVYLGSDMPLHQVALNLLKLDLLEMPEDSRAAIAGGNLAKLLRLDPTPVAVGSAAEIPVPSRFGAREKKSAGGLIG